MLRRSPGHPVPPKGSYREGGPTRRVPPRSGLKCCAWLLLWLALAPAIARAQDRALFEFQSAFWSNLHTYLHALTRAGAPLQESLPATATAGEVQQWEAALEVYRKDYGKRSQLFDEALVRAAVALAAAGSNPSLGDAKIPAEHRAALESAAPIYRRYFWIAHDKENRRFIAEMAPLLKQHGATIAERLSASFDATWPARPIPVDVVHDAGPPGNAHTVSDPPRITIGAGDRRHQGLAGLEVMFHEASHVWDTVLMKGVNRAAARLAVRGPRDLWHALLFFNAGVITADALAAAGVTDYRLYADVEGMFDRTYKGWRPAIAKHWPEFLAGRLTRDDAITNILREITPARGQDGLWQSTTGASSGRNWEARRSPRLIFAGSRFLPSFTTVRRRHPAPRTRAPLTTDD